LDLATGNRAEHEQSNLLVRKGERIQLTVLNGSGHPTLQGDSPISFEQGNSTLFEMANYSRSDVEQSFIIDEINDSSAAQKVAYALGIDPKKIEKKVDSNAFVDAALVMARIIYRSANEGSATILR